LGGATEITTCVLDTSGRKLIIGDEAGSVVCINYLTGAVLKKVDPHSATITYLGYVGPLDKCVLSCGMDGRLQMADDVDSEGYVPHKKNKGGSGDKTQSLKNNPASKNNNKRASGRSVVMRSLEINSNANTFTGVGGNVVVSNGSSNGLEGLPEEGGAQGGDDVGESSAGHGGRKTFVSNRRRGSTSSFEVSSGSGGVRENITVERAGGEGLGLDESSLPPPVTGSIGNTTAGRRISTRRSSLSRVGGKDDCKDARRISFLTSVNPSLSEKGGNQATITACCFSKWSRAHLLL